MTNSIKRPVAERADQLKEMEKLIAEGTLPKFPKAGDIVEGTVLSVARNEVKIDLAGLTTGVVRGRELEDVSGEYSDLKVGDMVSATILELENENGEMELSFQRAGHKRAWENLLSLAKEGKILPVKISNANKGGLMARVGKIAGFIPVSQLSPENYPRVEGGDKSKILEKLTKLVSQTLDVKIIDVSEKEDKLILSEKAAWEEKQKSVLAKYKVGDIVEGVITGIANFGAFIEFGPGLEGLVHISELAWQRIDNPTDVVKVGDKVSAEIISIQGSKISLSMKKLMADPWKEAAGRYSVGQMVKGKVLKVNPFGLFVELDDKIHGLAHISELGAGSFNEISKIAKADDVLDFKVISINPENHRLGLSRKEVDQPEQLAAEPQEAKAQSEEEVKIPATAHENFTAGTKNETVEKR